MSPSFLSRWLGPAWRGVAQRLVCAAGLAGLVGLAGLTPAGLRAQESTPPSAPDGQPVYVVAVVPQFPAVDIFRAWSPILTRLGQQVGARFELRVARDIPTFEAEVMEGKPDFAYMNPFHQVRAKRAQDYIPLVRDSKLLTGILVVRKDDPIRSPRQLAGQSLAFPAPNAFGASLLIRAHLAEIERIDINPVYTRTHTNAYRHTLSGKTQATGGLRATLEREPPEVQAGFRMLLETPGSAPHPLSAHPRVPAQVRQAVQAALLKLAREPALAAAFQEVPMAQPVRADYRRDYFPLERLKLDRYAE